MRAQRALVSAAVIGLHVGLLWLFLAGDERQEPRLSVLAIVPLTLIPLQAQRPLERPRRSAPSAPHRSRSPPAPPQAAAPGPSVAAPGARSTRPDWYRQAEQAAADQTQAELARQRQAAALSSRITLRSAAPIAVPDFAWDPSATHRIEAVGGSGVEKLAHIDERCALVLFMGLPFSADCALGRIPARGDLFKRLHDRPSPGQRDDPGLP